MRQAHPIHSSELQAGAAAFDELGELSSQRVVSIDYDTVVLLQTHLERRGSLQGAPKCALSSEDRVCVKRDGSAIIPNALMKGYKRIAKRCGTTDVRFHDFRHTHATMLLLEAGAPVHVVQARMGHESIQTTVNTYGHVLPASDFAAAVALREKLT